MAAALLVGSARGRRTGPCSRSTRRRAPSSNGEYFCDSITAFLLLWKSTSISSRPASIRATSSASMPAGCRSNGWPPPTSARPRPRARRSPASRFRSRDRRCSRFAKCRPARRRSCRSWTRKYFSVSMSALGDGAQQPRRGRPLQRQRRDLLGDVVDLDVEPGGVLGEPAQVRIGRGPSVRLLRQPRHRPVVDHLAVSSHHGV